MPDFHAPQQMIVTPCCLCTSQTISCRRCVEQSCVFEKVAHREERNAMDIVPVEDNMTSDGDAESARRRRRFACHINLGPEVFAYLLPSSRVSGHRVSITQDSLHSLVQSFPHPFVCLSSFVTPARSSSIQSTVRSKELFGKTSPAHTKHEVQHLRSDGTGLYVHGSR